MGDGHDHFLARCHLRGFSFDAGKHVWQMDKRTGEAEAVSVRDAAVKHGLNTIIRRGRRDRSLEPYMAAQERRIAPLLRRLRAMPTAVLALSGIEDDLLSAYIALTYARSPQWRGGLGDRARTAMAMVARQLEDRDAVEAALRHTYTAKDEVTRLRLLVELRAGRMPEDVAIDPWPITVGVAGRRPALLIGTMTKFIVHRASTPGLVCGDCAVVLMHDNAYYAPSQLGFGGANVRVVMPISPDVFVVSTFADAARHRDLIEHWQSDDVASFVNRATFEHAGGFVFAQAREDLFRAQKEFDANRLAG